MKTDEHTIIDALDTNDAGYNTETGLPWPSFAVGDNVSIQGYPFTIQRINASNLVMRPLPARGLGSPRNLMLAMTGRGA